MSKDLNKKLLPDSFRKPFALLWSNLIPQLILIAINLKAFWFIKEEIKPENFNLCWLLLVIQIIMILLALLCMFVNIRKKSLINWAWNMAILITHIGYLWFISVNLSKIIPFNIEPWILDQGTLTLYQFSLIMPAVFYSGVSLATFRTRLKPVQDFIASLLTAIITPILFYVFITFIMSFIYRSNFNFPEFISILFFIIVTVVAFSAFLRVLVFSYNWIRNQESWLYILAVSLVVLVCPLAGLALNITIPFPANFQSPLVYIVTIINGLILLIPKNLSKDNRRLSLFLRSLTYPFTLYFFMVFLPFLPLALPALFAIGLGFLFLTPTALFVVHTKRLLDDLKSLLKEKSKTPAMAIVFLGIMILPLIFFINSYSDRSNLGKALDYVYSADYSRELKFNGSLKSIERVLITMKNVKEGAQLPYISSLYNKIVFDGMVLPDKKIKYMYRLFTGRDITTVNRGFGLFSARRNAVGWGRRNAFRPREIAQDVDITSVEVSNEQLPQTIKARIKLQMHNTSASNEAEFFRKIIIPQGILVTDFRLKVEQDLVKGRIFEKKTALWVYHMIRDFTRRDPGILTYRSPTEIDFNIYPFRQDETRYAEIEMQFPRYFSPTVFIGERPIYLNQSFAKQTSPPFVQSPENSEKTYVIISKETLNALPRFKRQPYLHFILDFSKSAEKEIASYHDRILNLLSKFTDIKEIKLTAANFESRDLGPEFIAFANKAEISKALSSCDLPVRGGLDLGQVIKNELLKYNSKSSKDTVHPYQWFQHPVFVVLTDSFESLFEPEDMEFFRPLLPDCNSYYLSEKGKKLKNQLLWDISDEIISSEVIALKLGTAVSILSSDPKTMKIAYGRYQNSKTILSVYEPRTNQFIKQDNLIRLKKDSGYKQGLDLFLKNEDILINPSTFKSKITSLLDRSRESGILLPSTAYIIVERSSQWKILEEKEKQRLRSAQGLEFDEQFDTPGPYFILILLGSVFFFIRAKKLQNIK